jgi:hypothetical protein
MRRAKTLVRSAALIMLVLGTLSVPADAQTYGDNYPVCLQVFGRFPRFECGYTSIAQCLPSASAIAAQCVVNPYYIPPHAVAPRARHRGPRH